MNRVLRDIPEYEFENEGVVFAPSSCDHGAVPNGSWQAARANLMINGDEGEDHLLPPHVILSETFHPIPDDGEESPLFAHAANPLAPEEVRRIASQNQYDLLNGLLEYWARICEAPDNDAWHKEIYKYKNHCVHIAKEQFSILKHLITPSDANAKLAKALGFNWSTDGLSLLPNLLAGIGDLCPYASPSCTAMCLNWSGRTEISGPWRTNQNILARKRRSLLYYWQPDVFFMRLFNDVTRRAAKFKQDKIKYAFRANVLSDIAWEKMLFFNPWARGETTIIDAFDEEAVKWYDYTKNPLRYLNMLKGEFPVEKYHLTFSLSEINALFAFYALDHGGSVAVVFDTDPGPRGANKPSPLPKTFCGYDVIDGDKSDLRFLDREMFGIPQGKGFVVGLRLKGTKHRETHFRRLAQDGPSGFVFPEHESYNMDDVIDKSEQRRQDIESKVRPDQGFKGAERRKFWAGIPPEMIPMLTTWWKGR